MQKFSKITEAQVTEAIIKDFYKRFSRDIMSDVIIIGAGPSGLIAGGDLASAGLHVVIIEANNYLGGGFWMGGYLMNTVTFRAPADNILDELSIPYKKAEEGLFTASAPQACSKLIADTCDKGASIINMTRFDDIVIRENSRVAGAVINWTPIASLPKAVACLDPLALESRLVIDASGHDAVVAASLAKRGMLKIKAEGAMYVEKSEDLVVENTVEVYPGVIACGMAVAAVFGVPRMGPTFGAMLASGRKAADIAKEILNTAPDMVNKR